MLGTILAVTAAFCWGTGAIFARLGLQRIKTSTGTFISMLSSLLIVGLLALGVNFDAIKHVSLAAVIWFSLIGLVNYLLGRQFNYISIRHIGVAKAMPLFSTAPLFSLILAVAFLGESVNAAIVLGTLTIMGGIYLVITSK